MSRTKATSKKKRLNKTLTAIDDREKSRCSKLTLGIPKKFEPDLHLDILNFQTGLLK